MSNKTFHLMIECNNAAFAGRKRFEVARILSEVADALRESPVGRTGTVRDVNGNRVCAWAFRSSDTFPGQSVSALLDVDSGAAVTGPGAIVHRQGRIPEGTVVFRADRDAENPIPPTIRDRNVERLCEVWNTAQELADLLD